MRKKITFASRGLNRLERRDMKGSLGITQKNNKTITAVVLPNDKSVFFPRSDSR